jgi:thiol-disulfide isomerase/thioredoxin
MHQFYARTTLALVILSALLWGCSGTNNETTTAAKKEPVGRKSKSDRQTMVSLHIGDPAPPLQIADWVTGTPVATFEKGRVYVVEFWATWCDPCKASMPHISQLQEEYADTVTFVGVTDENRDQVDDFLASPSPEDKPWSEIVKYNLALDTSGRDTSTAYMKAAGQNGIPTAFVVGRTGHVEWIGHPAAIDAPLQQIVDDNWNRDQFASQLARKQERQAAILKAFALIKQKKYAAGLDVLKSVVDDEWQDAGFLNQVAWMTATEFPAEDRDLAWTEKVALRAAELTQHQEAAILDTVARVYYERANLASAIEWQQKAVDLADDTAYSETLAKYESERDGAATQNRVQASP